jgi:hypothetical protein
MSFPSVLSTQDIDPNNPNQRRFFLLRWLVNVWHWVLPPTQAHQDRESSGTRRLRAGVLITVCLTAIVLAAVYAKPLQDAYQVWQADRYLLDAKRYLDDKDIVSAVVNAQKAHQVAPDHEPAVRMNAELLTLVRRPQALYFWDKLEKQAALSTQDELGRVRALLGINRPREAQQLLQAVIAKEPLNPEAMKLAEEVVGKQEATDMMMDVLKNFADKNPDDIENRLRLARLQLKSSQPAEAGQGMETLWSVIGGDDQRSLDAIRELAGLEKLDSAQRQQLAGRLEQHPLADGWDWTRALTLRTDMAPLERDALIDKTAERFHGKKGEALLPLIRWFVTHQEHGRVLTWLGEDDVKRVEPLLLNYLTALTMLNRLPALERLVNDPEVIMSPATRAFYQAHLAVVKSVSDRASGITREDLKQKLRAALVATASEGKIDMVLTIGAYCTDKLHDFYDVAADCYQTATRSFKTRIEKPAFEGWIKAARLSGDSSRLSEAASEASRRWPDDKTFLEHVLYVRLLRGELLETSSVETSRLLEANPEDSIRKFLRAMALWRLGDAEGAVSAAQRIELLKVSPGQQAVFAAIVRDLGAKRVTKGDMERFESTVQSIVSAVPRDVPLLAEEARLITRAEQR